LPLKNKYKAIVIGTSAGGLYALTKILSKLPSNFPLPIVIVQHRAKDQKDLLEEVLQSKCKIKIKQADEKEAIENGIVYLAPPDYHLLIEVDETFSLSADEPWLYSRPSIDILFESAAIVYREKLIAIILTGANSDGSRGIVAINNFGGLTIAQQPVEAEYPDMPKAAIETKKIKYIWTIAQIGDFLMKSMYS
jgi:two-component system chemotaxis response regulator CheB